MKKPPSLDPEFSRGPGPSLIPPLLATAALLALVVLGTALMVRRGPAAAPPPAVVAAAGQPESALERAINSFFEGLAAWMTAVVVFAAVLLVLVVYGQGWAALLLLADAGTSLERLMTLILAIREYGA